MADIKKRQKNKGTIRTLDRASVMAEHMRTATVRTRDTTVPTKDQEQRSEVSYGIDHAGQMAGDSAHAAVGAGTKAASVGVRKSYQIVRSRRNVADAKVVETGQQIRTRRSMVGVKQRKEMLARSRRNRETEAKHISEAKIKTPNAAQRANAVRNAAKRQQMKKAAVQRAEAKTRQASRKAAEGAKKSARITYLVLRKIIGGAKALLLSLGAGGIIALIVILVCILFGAAFYFFGDDSSDNYTPVSAEVEAYTPVIQKYAGEYGIPEYTELIKAIMMQESGGRGKDPMQAAEGPFNKKYPKKPNGITDPDYSIRCGVQEIKSCLEQAKCNSPLDMDHIRLALQGYNYGNGYISWAVKRDGGYTVENASVFSDQQAKKHGWKSYGDKQYVAHVLRYYPYGSYNYGVGNKVIVDVAAKQIGNHGGKKFWSWYGFSGHVHWCACFVSWCADQCGYIKSKTIPKFSLVSDGINWFKNKHQWQKRGYKPNAGDIIFFDWKGDGHADHVGIVEKCDGKNVYTIEGNSGDKCQRQQYSVNSSVIFGYGVPKY